MNWLFHITATPAPRLLMRVAMVFDQQFLTPGALDWRCSPETSRVDLRLCVVCEEALARRIHAKLFRLQDILDVRIALDAETPPTEISFSAHSNGGAFESEGPATTTEA